jgi:hypothetical protein
VYFFTISNLWQQQGNKYGSFFSGKHLNIKELADFPNMLSDGDRLLF